MEGEAWEAPSSKEEDEVEVVYLVGVNLRPGSGEVEVLQWMEEWWSFSMAWS